MANPILKRFTVSGAGPFPLDMLRVDQGWPASPADAARIAGRAADVVNQAARVVTIETAAKYAPDRRGWIRVGWRVLD